jgi:RNA polymerase sigma factor (sigma-70 family)
VNVDLKGCIAGQKHAWDQFVRQTAPIIYAAVQRAMRHQSFQPHDVDDRVQDVFVRLVQRDFHLLRAYDANRSSLSTWLTLISRSVVHEHQQRKRLATASLEAADGVAKLASATDPPDVSLDVLTSRQRLVIQMLFDEGMTVEQAANRLEVDPQTIRSTKHKALLRLRQQIGIGDQSGANAADSRTSEGSGDV